MASIVYPRVGWREEYTLGFDQYGHTDIDTYIHLQIHNRYRYFFRFHNKPIQSPEFKPKRIPIPI